MIQRNHRVTGFDFLQLAISAERFFFLMKGCFFLIKGLFFFIVIQRNHRVTGFDFLQLAISAERFCFFLMKTDALGTLS